MAKEEIAQNKGNIVILVRPSMKFDLEHIHHIEGGNLIYSLWQGHLSQEYTGEFVSYLSGRRFELFQIHTSGHADIEALSKLVNSLNPKTIVPIHTFQGRNLNSISPLMCDRLAMMKKC